VVQSAYIVDARLKAEGNPSQRSSARAEREQAARMLKEGQEFLAQGNVMVARACLARAAELGAPFAALRLAETHDPREPGHFVNGLRRDSREARKWYQRAVELGVSAAKEKLRRLGS